MLLSPEPPKPRRRRGQPDALPDTSVPLLPDRRSEAMREARCRRVVERRGDRLVRRISSGGFNVIDRQGNWSDEMTLEELEESTLGRMFPLR